MSSIPNSAMPHAGPSAESQSGDSGESGRESLTQRAGSLAREYPKTAMAAGAAVAAGVAAAAIPLVRASRGRSDGKAKSSGKKGG